MSKEYTVAILGATGAVGNRMIQQLEQSSIPVKELHLLASARSAGKTLTFRGQEVEVEETTPDSFEGVDLVLSSAGGAPPRSSCPKPSSAGRSALITLRLTGWIRTCRWWYRKSTRRP